jgi:hypothetical protein
VVSQSCFPYAHCGVVRKPRPADAASVDAAAAGHVAQSIAGIVGTQTASPWCESARVASDVLVARKIECMLCRCAAVACRFLEGEMLRL